MPTTPYLICDHCRTVLPTAVVNTSEPVACPGCHAPLLARVFPAFSRAGTGGHASESVVSDEDASCFYHPRKKAVVPCVRCGRFLCALCDLEIDGQHLCPGCLSAAQEGNKITLVIRYWNEPRQRPMPQGRARLIVAGMLALGQIGFWGYILYRSFHHLSASI